MCTQMGREKTLKVWRVPSPSNDMLEGHFIILTSDLFIHIKAMHFLLNQPNNQSPYFLLRSLCFFVPKYKVILSDWVANLDGRDTDGKGSFLFPVFIGCSTSALARLLIISSR